MPKKTPLGAGHRASTSGGDTASGNDTRSAPPSQPLAPTDCLL
ncbi:MAG: hypothetical protein QNJ97_10510 [Myxococcota bacterium]|nr:hypothetical protein [Myxococcota bacterium]